MNVVVHCYAPSVRANSEPIMPALHLTDLVVRNLKVPDQGTMTYTDDSVPGFQVRVSAGGAKAFSLVHGRNRARVAIGRYPTLSLADARTEAKRLLAEEALGKHRAPRVLFEKAVDTFLISYCKQKQSAGTAKESKRILNKHFMPSLRHKNLGEIRTQDVTKVLDRLLDTPSEANHAFAKIRLFFRWALRMRHIESSPCAALQMPAKSVSRDRVLTDLELAKVWGAATEYPFGTIVRLLILTGARRGEIASLRSDYIDNDKKTITLPHTKNKRPHTFPYSDMAAAIFEAVPGEEGYLFPGRGSDDAVNGWSKFKLAFDKRCRIEPWTLHDLRRTFATNLAALGTPIQVTEKLLNHISGASGGIVGIYQRHTYQAEMRTAIEAWEKRLSALCEKHSSVID
jgi:integrase